MDSYSYTAWCNKQSHHAVMTVIFCHGSKGKISRCEQGESSIMALWSHQF